MAFPLGWPSSTGTGRKTIRFYASGTTTSDWEDNAFIFSDALPEGQCKKGSAFPLEAIRVFNNGTADILVTFDGSSIHGVVRPGETLEYKDRVESGIAVKSTAGPPSRVAAFRIEAW